MRARFCGPRQRIIGALRPAECELSVGLRGLLQACAGFRLVYVCYQTRDVLERSPGRLLEPCSRRLGVRVVFLARVPLGEAESCVVGPVAQRRVLAPCQLGRQARQHGLQVAHGVPYWWHRGAESVLRGCRNIEAFDPRDRGTAHCDAGAGHYGNRDRVPGENWAGWTDRKPWRGAVDVQILRTRRDAALVKNDGLGLDPANPPEADDVADRPQLFHLRFTARCATKYSRPHRRVQPEYHAALFQILVGLVDRGGSCDGLDDARRAVDDVPGKVARLEVEAVVEPEVTRPDPGDAVWTTALVEQPHAGIHRSLASADNDVPGRWFLQPTQLAGRDKTNAVGHLERSRIGGRYL